MELLIVILKSATLLTAGIAAFLWLNAAKSEVAPTKETRVALGLGDRNIDLARTLALQSKRNVLAAKGSAIAFLFQTAQYIAENWHESWNSLPF